MGWVTGDWGTARIRVKLQNKGADMTNITRPAPNTVRSPPDCGPLLQESRRVGSIDIRGGSSSTKRCLCDTGDCSDVAIWFFTAVAMDTVRELGGISLRNGVVPPRRMRELVGSRSRTFSPFIRPEPQPPPVRPGPQRPSTPSHQLNVVLSLQTPEPNPVQLRTNPVQW